jgi:hypothetical protein
MDTTSADESPQTAAAEARAASLIGRRFGRLVVTGVTWIQRPKSKRIGVDCRCDCGGAVAIAVYSLLGRPDGRSCGCAIADFNRRTKTKHGYAPHSRSRHPLYGVWANMRSRCNNPNHQDFHNYGGRGIRVCPEWDDFAEFVKYIAGLLPPGATEIPAGLTIDRYPDRNGSYEPGNVRLASSKMQCRNTRANVEFEIDGVRKCLSDWCEQFGLPVPRVHARLKRGWSITEALTGPRYRHVHRQPKRSGK